MSGRDWASALKPRKRERVPDGPPVRWVGCTYDCETRWDREPRHSAECERRRREANERVSASQFEADDALIAYLDYRRERGLTAPKL